MDGEGCYKIRAGKPDIRVNGPPYRLYATGPDGEPVAMIEVGFIILAGKREPGLQVSVHRDDPSVPVYVRMP